MVSALLKHEFLPEEEVMTLCDRARGLLAEESNVQLVRAPVTVVGDIHGQFHDMMEMFKMGGLAPGYELSVFGGLRRSRVLLGGDGDVGRRAQGEVSGSGDDHSWESRVETDHAGVRVLRRVHAEVRTRGNLEGVYTICLISCLCRR